MRLFSLVRDALALFAFAAALCLVPFAAVSQTAFPPVAKVLVAVNPITNRIYVVDEFANAVRVIDESAGTTRTIPVDTRPQFIAVNPATNRIYTSNNNSGSITVIDGATETTTTLPIGSLGPMAIDATRNLIYIVRLSSAQYDEVTYLSGNTNEQYSISARMYQPTSIGLNPLTQEILVPGYSTGRVAILDARFRGEGYPCGHEGVDPYTCPTLGTGVKPFMAAMDPMLDKGVGISENAGSALWIANVAGRTIANFALDASGTMYQPRGLAINPVTHKAYAVFDGRLAVVDIAAGTFEVIVDARFAGTSAVGVAVNASTNKIYVAAEDGKLTIVDGVSNARTPVTIPAGLSSIGVNPVTNKVYLAGTSTATTVLDGVAGSATVPLTTTITPLAGDQAGRDVTLTMNAASGFAPSAMPIRKVYWQLDGTGAAWTAATGSGTGPYTVSLTNLAPGSHTLRAFAADGQDAPVNTGPQSMPLVGAIASYTFTVAGNPSTVSLAASSATSFVGQSVTFTASVSGSAGTPTGTAQFRDGATTITGCGSVTLGGGSAQCTTSALSTGSHSVTAVYSGDSTYEGATSSAVTHTVNPLPAPTVALASSLNPSTSGQGVTFTANVSGSRGTATGTVQFRDGGASIAGCAGVTLAAGTAQCTTASLGVGSRSITAVYSGDASYASAASSALTQTVNAAPVSPVLSLTSSLNPSTAGRSVTFTAGVSGSRGTATGTVDFRDGGNAISGCTGLTLASGSATCSTASLSTGSRSITARYNGDSNYLATTSAALTQTVNPAPQPQLTLSASAVAFGGQSMGTTSPAQALTASNTGNASLDVTGVSVSNAQFAATHDCATLAPGATCTITLTFSPAATAGALNSQVSVNGTLSVSSSAPASPATASVSGTAQKSLATHFYQSILRRAPDAGGREYWEGEAARVAGLGANVNEAWYALAMTFFQSQEYRSFERTDTAYLTDLYRTFFNRDPDAAGRAYWTDLLSRGMPRGVVLAEFMLSPEFRHFSAAIFGDTTVRAEIDMTGDFYRGLLGRLPDSTGFEYWLGRFRSAQCQGGSAVVAAADEISASFLSGPEYVQRARTNAEFVADLYNAFLRRGGDLEGVRYWIGELDRGALTRDEARRTFTQTTEFQNRVQRVITAGCQQ